SATVPLEAMGEAIGGGIAYVEQLARGNREGAAAIREQMQATDAFEGPLANLLDFYDRLYDSQEELTESAEDGTDADEDARAAAERRSEFEERLRDILNGRTEEEEDGAEATRDRADAEAEAIAGMERQLGLLGDVTTAEEIRWEVERGRYSEMSDATQTRLMELAREIDAQEAAREAEEQAARNRQQLMDEGRRMSERMRTDQERTADELERLDELLAGGVVGIDTYTRAMAEAHERQHETAEKSGEAAEDMNRFWDQAARNAQSALADYFYDPVNEDTEDLVDNFADAMRRMAAEALAAKALTGIAGFFGVSMSTGGRVRGPGTSTSDSIPGWLSDGEYVVQAPAVDHYGQGLMDAINNRELPRERRMAEGGPVSPASSAGPGAGARAQLEVGLAEGLVVNSLRQRDGESAIIRVLGRNPRAAREALGM
ncbi:MAG: hypothetical protein ACODAB_10085, partial [Gemmatimonadota bacterium]